MHSGHHGAPFHHEAGAAPSDATVAFAKRVEDAGFERFSEMDYGWQPPFVGRRDEPFFDCYMTLPAIAPATDDIEISALVACVYTATRRCSTAS